MRLALTLSLSAALLASLFAAPPPAAATVDAGYAACVLAYVGDPPRYAVLGHREVDCGGWAHALFLVDLTSEAQRSLEVRANTGQGWPFPVPPEADASDERAIYEAALIHAYLESLPEPFQQAFAAGFERVDDEDPAPFERPRLAARIHVTPTPSMAPFERFTRQPCLEWQQADGQHQARCPTCRLEPLGDPVVDGHAWVCDPRFTLALCDCRDTGAWMRLVVTDLDSGRVVSGERFLVAPHELLQADAGMEVGSASPPHLELVDLTIHATPRAFIIAGTAANAPSANGTWYPLWAVVPRTADAP